MTFWRWMTISVLGLSLSFGPRVAGELPGERSRYLADYANGRYAHAAIETLRELVAFRTVNPEGVRPASTSGFRALTDYFRNKAEEFGFDFRVYGMAVVLGLGKSRDRLGLLAHADVQPAEPAKWSKDPFILDTESEPGKLIGRGAEDDKGPISAALYAMKTLADFDVELGRRIELIIVYTEESDWNAIRQFLSSYDPPELNVSLDGAYPVVVAEKGWGEIHVSFPPDDGPLQADVPTITSFTGGVFLSQIPENSEVTIIHAPPKLERKLRETTRRHSEIDFTFFRKGEELVVRAKGLAAHSAAPEKGFNSLTHLAALIGEPAWSDTREARMVQLINDLVGTGDLAGQFGDLAYSDPFMGPLTLTLARLRLTHASGSALSLSMAPVL